MDRRLKRVVLAAGLAGGLGAASAAFAQAPSASQGPDLVLQGPATPSSAASGSAAANSAAPAAADSAAPASSGEAAIADVEKPEVTLPDKENLVLRPVFLGLVAALFVLVIGGAAGANDRRDGDSAKPKPPEPPPAG